MYAIIETGGKQYFIEEGQILDVELLSEDKKVTFSNVLMFNDGKKNYIGAPTLNNCTVTGEVLNEVKGPKTIAFKYRKRKDSKKTIGHRQRYCRVKITSIKVSKGA